ncbi:MAG: protein kinase [Mycobacterium sp.]|nr:protein kinase [Mycobacterium sp.]
MRPDPLVGALLDGRYRVEARIATGGMSTVYRGLDVRLDRPVALKVMDARYASDHQFLTRFHREARAIASLKHPGLVAIYDQGNDPAHPFLVMELIEGGTLRELLRERGPMPPHAVVAALRPVLGGLGVAHRAGLVHRDIKPENVLISDDGEVKLVDFGLVRAIAEAGVTSTSVILGTAAYLSPEQVLGADTEPRSDVYSAGIMAFELLTGATPFNGDSAITVANQRLEQDVPPPSSMIDGVPEEFDAFIARATARNPDDRFADASEMIAELDAIAEDLALPQFRVPAPQNSAQHSAAAVTPPVRRPTRQLTRGPGDWQPVAVSDDDAETALVRGDEVDEPDEYDSPSRQFAGINIDEFAWARQRSRRILAFWVLTVFVLTGLVALAGWELGLNFNALIGR